MDRLISDIIELPERVRKGDFVLNLSKGVTEPEKTLDQYVVTPQLVGVLRRCPWASSSRPWTQPTARRATCTAASVPASRTSWPCCTCCSSTTPPCARMDVTRQGLRQARLGRGQEVPARAVPHDRRPQHGVGHPGRLRRSCDASFTRTPRCRASTWPTRSSRTPCSTGRRSGDEKFFAQLNQGQKAGGGRRAGASSPRAGMRPGSRRPSKPRPPARNAAGWSATWCSTSSRPSRGIARARTKPTSISTWACRSSAPTPSRSATTG